MFTNIKQNKKFTNTLCLQNKAKTFTDKLCLQNTTKQMFTKPVYKHVMFTNQKVYREVMFIKQKFTEKLCLQNKTNVDRQVTFTKQMFTGRVKYMQEAFRDATFVPHGYLFVDLKQSTPEHLRLRSNIIPDSGTYQDANIPNI